MLSLIAALRGSTTVFSTHILSDVERVCDHVLVLASGRASSRPYRGTAGSLRRQPKLQLDLVEQRAALPEALVGERWLTDLQPSGEGWLIDVVDMATAHTGCRQSSPARLGLRRLEPVEASLTPSST